MAKGRRSFKSRSKQPFLFDIDGAEFATVRRISGAMFVDFIRQIQGFQGSTGGTVSFENLAAFGDTIHDMYASVMEDEEFDRFWKWARSPDGCDFETLVEVLSEMVSDDTDRPTVPPRPSRSGRAKTGTTSTDD